MTTDLQHLLIVFYILLILASFQRIYFPVGSRFLNLHFFNNIFSVPSNNLVVIDMALLTSIFQVADLVLPVQIQDVETVEQKIFLYDHVERSLGAEGGAVVYL